MARATSNHFTEDHYKIALTQYRKIGVGIDRYVREPNPKNTMYRMFKHLTGMRLSLEDLMGWLINLRKAGRLTLKPRSR